jgi:hypothetical protein
MSNPYPYKGDARLWSLDANREPDILAIAKVLHNHGPLSWLEWDKLDEETRQEYMKRAQETRTSV